MGLYLIWNILRRDLCEWGWEVEDKDVEVATNDRVLYSWNDTGPSLTILMSSLSWLFPVLSSIPAPCVSWNEVVVALNESLEGLKFHDTRIPGGNHEVKTMDTLYGALM